MPGIWHTCTLEGLSSKKEEVLGRVVKALERKGFKLRHTESWFQDQISSQIPTVSFSLFSPKTGLEIEFHVESINTDMKFSHSFFWEELGKHTLPKWLYFLWLTFFFVGGFLYLGEELTGEPSLLERLTNEYVDHVFVIIWFLAVMFGVFLFFRRERAERKYTKYIAKTIQKISRTKPTFKEEITGAYDEPRFCGYCGAMNRGDAIICQKCKRKIDYTHETKEEEIKI